MTSLNQVFGIFAFGKKLFSIEGLAVALISTPGSITMATIFEKLIKDIPAMEFMLPILVVCASVIFFNSVFVLDFWSGLQASKKENGSKKYFSSSKAYSSMFKYFTVLSILFMLFSIAILTALAHFPSLSKIFTIWTGVIGMSAGFFEIKSIGENIERISSKRYPFFDFINNLSRIFEEGVGERLRTLLRLPPKK